MQMDDSVLTLSGFRQELSNMNHNAAGPHALDAKAHRGAAYVIDELFDESWLVLALQRHLVEPDKNVKRCFQVSWPPAKKPL